MKKSIIQFSLFSSILLMGQRVLAQSTDGNPPQSIFLAIADFLTNPIVVVLLLTIGCVALVMELFSTGFGVYGMVGLFSFFLFFYSHLMIGLTSYEIILLFIVGIVLFFLELFLPSGIVGLIGIVAILVSFFLSTSNITQMLVSILIAFSVAIVVFILMVKVYGKEMKLFRKLILTDSTNTESGYISNKNRSDLVGQIGHTLTALRPAGTLLIGGERIDVVSEGNFIPKGEKVQVVKAEGSRIVVREISLIEKEEE